jgi:outer membrane protein assembly factor BamB
MLSPVVANGKVVFGTGRPSIHCFDVTDGGNHWRYVGGIHPNATTSVLHDTLYSCLLPEVFAYDLMSGELLWQVGRSESSGPDNCAPVIDTLTRMLYLYRFLQGQSMAFNLNSRQVQYRGKLPDDTIGVWELAMGVMSRAPVLNDGVLYLVERGNLSALNPMTGDSLWSIAGYRFHYTPVGANGLIFASNDTLTCAIDIYARKVVWSIDIGGELSIANNSLYIATVDGWVYVYGDVLTDVEDDRRPPELPTDYHLSQNYPNPFNPSTTIEYRLPVRSEVELCIYNILGQRVRTLVSGPRSAGDHTVVWDGTADSGRRVATGIYFYRLKTPGFVQTKKMVLVK